MALFALVCALPGMPTIYYGDEAGMQGAGDPYNRGTYPWGHEDQELIAFYARTIARRRAEPLWRRGALALLAPHPDVLLVVRGWRTAATPWASGRTTAACSLRSTGARRR